MSGMRIVRRLGVAAALAALAALSLAGLSQARPFDRATFHDEFSDVAADFCDTPGLTVRTDFVVDGRFIFNARGSAGLAYYMEHVRVTRVDTNLANGNFVTSKSTVTDKDLKVVNNHDGTLTIIALATGNDVLYDMDGKAIARNPGQVRFALLVDHNGTPKDPSDDEFLADLGTVKESTGRSDDFCEAAVPVLS